MSEADIVNEGVTEGELVRDTLRLFSSLGETERASVAVAEPEESSLVNESLVENSFVNVLEGLKESVTLSVAEDLLLFVVDNSAENDSDSERDEGIDSLIELERDALSAYDTVCVFLLTEDSADVDAEPSEDMLAVALSVAVSLLGLTTTDREAESTRLDSVAEGCCDGLCVRLGS